METMSLWCHPSLSLAESRARIGGSSRNLEVLRVSSDLKLDGGEQRRRGRGRRQQRQRQQQIPASGATQSIETADSPARSSARRELTVAALEDAFNQVSASSSSDLDDEEEGLLASMGRTRLRTGRKKRSVGRAAGRLELSSLSLDDDGDDRDRDRNGDGGDEEKIWSDEAEELIRLSFSLKPVDWRNLRHGFLTAKEEIDLVELMNPVKHLQQIRAELRRVLRREPSDDEWAMAANTTFKTLRRRLQLGQAAQNRLIQQNCRLVLFLARKYEKDAGSFSLEDLCQEGIKGLIDAMDHFKPNKGARFSTYAIFWIRTAIVRAITRTGQIIRLPFSFAAKKMEIRKARRDLRTNLGRDPSSQELMEKTGLDPVQFWNIQFRVRSLNETIGGTDEELLEYLPETGDIVSERPEIRDEVDAALRRLKPKERLVLQHRYGFEDGVVRSYAEVRSLREVGRQLNMSREMVRKYEANALERLRHQEEAKSLRSSLASIN